MVTFLGPQGGTQNCRGPGGGVSSFAHICAREYAVRFRYKFERGLIRLRTGCVSHHGLWLLCARRGYSWRRCVAAVS